MTTEVEKPTEPPVATNGDAPKAEPAPKVELTKPEKRFEKPDRKVLDEQIEKLQTQIDKCQARVQEIKSLIDGKREGRKNVGSGPGQVARNRLAELRAEFRARLDEKNAMRAELAAADAARESLRGEAKAIKEKLSFVRVEQIDEEIEKLEHKMTHSTINIDEERRTVEHIKQLRKSRDLVKTYNDRLERLQEDDSVRKAIFERIKEKDTVINAIKAEEAQQKSVLDGIRAEEEAKVSDIPALSNERNESYEIIREARDAVRNLKMEFKTKEDEYYQREREWRAYERQEKQKRWEAGQAERKEREERRKAYLAANAPEPFVMEIMAIEQLCAYLAPHVQSAEPVAEEPSTSAPATPSAAKGLEKMFVVSRKSDRDEDYYSTGKKGKKGKKHDKPKKDKEAGPVRMVHSLDVLASFAKLKLKAPLLTSDAAASLAELKEKETVYLEKQKAAKERKERGEPEPPEEKEEEEEEKKEEPKAEEETKEEPKAEETKAEATKEEEKPAEEAAPSEEDAAKAAEKEAKKAAKAAEKEAKAAEKAKKDAAKALKAVVKEGGKKGVEIAGAADMGGLDFFCSNMQEPKGSVELLEASMAAMNKEPDPEEEEMKGGSGHVGKMIFSASEEGDNAQCAAVAFVPEDKQAKVNAKEWMEHVLAQYKPTGELIDGATAGYAVGVVKHNPDEGQFLLKFKDSMLPTARDYLKSKGAIPEKEADSDDDMGWMEEADDEIEW